jgi:hypothetical protein
MWRQCLEVIGSREMTVPGSKWQSQAVTMSGRYWDSGMTVSGSKGQCLAVI